jgi:hypothetical protein
MEIKNMAKKDIGIYDKNSGEILEDVSLGVYQVKKYNGFVKNGWMAVNQGALKLLRTSGLQGKDYEVLFALLERLDFGNFIHVNQSEIARILNMKQPNIARSIKKLVDIEALIEGPKVSRSRTYKLNPEFGWKGSGKSHRKELDQKRHKKGLTILDGGKLNP